MIKITVWDTSEKVHNQSHILRTTQAITVYQVYQFLQNNLTSLYDGH